MANQTVRRDFFTSVTRVSIHKLKDFFTKVVLNMDPKKCPPIIIWGAPGTAKSSVVEQIFGQHKYGLKTVICSQLNPLDSYGLANIDEEVYTDKDGITRTRKITDFTPTKAFGRGENNLFLDELNNASPSMMAAVQNLLSAKVMGGDKYDHVYIIAACNPPSTNSLANDLNAPIMSRCLHVVVDYTLDDFISYSAEVGTMHPAVVAFHKKTSGAYLQAKWEVIKDKGYEVPEPIANEPYPCPRAWTLASDLMNVMSHNGGVDYSLLEPMIAGTVGCQAATALAQTYAYMDKIVDFEKVYKGEIKAKDANKTGEVAVEYISTFAAINFATAKIMEAKTAAIKCILPKADAKKKEEKTEAWHLLAGLHRLIQYINNSCSPELAQMATRAMSEKLHILPESFHQNLFSDIDPENGLTRNKTFVNMSKTANNNRDQIESAIR